VKVILRDDTNPLFIAVTLKTIKEKKEPCLIWQNSGGKRLVTNGTIFDINYTANAISLKPIEGKFLFSTAEDIYLQCEYKHLLFKSKITFRSASSIMVKIPKEIKAIEARAEQRISLLSMANPIDMTLIKYKAYESIPVEYVFRSADISNCGGSFIITSSSLPNFLVDDKILIKSLGNEVFKAPFEARIRNISAFQNPQFQNFGHHRVGFKFSEKIEAIKLDAIKYFLDSK
jgi:hypothetical protein